MKCFAEKYSIQILSLFFLLLYLLLLLEYLRLSPLARVPVVDADYYWRIAVDTGILGKPLPPMFFSAPLYPLTLTAAVFLVGYNLAAVYVLQMAAAFATGLLAALCARNVFGKGHGSVAFVLVMAYFPLAFFSLKVLPEVFSLFFLALFLALASRYSALSRPRDAASLGLAAGAAVLVRSQYTLVVAVVFFLLFFIRQEPGWKRFAAKRMLAVCAAALVPVLCWGLINQARTGTFFLSPPNGGPTFYQGNNPSARGLYTPIPGLTDDINGQLDGMVALASRNLGRPVTVTEADRYFFLQGLSFIRNHPGDWLRLEARKAVLAVGPREPGLIYSMALEKKHHLSLHRAFFLPWPLLVALFLTGLADMLLFERKLLRPALPCLGAAAALFTALLLFYVTSRYRILLLFPAAVVGSHGVAAFVRWISRRSIAPVVCAALLLGLAVYWTARYPEEIAPAAWNNISYALIRQERFAEAEEASRRVLSAHPGDPVALSNMASALLSQKRPQEAALFIEKLAQNPDFASRAEGYRKALQESAP
ncbi:MAG: glycosyltransferase family 39 protein [Thermodesulfobacteriota bacterium]